jgi:hypothetical protein
MGDEDVEGGRKAALPVAGPDLDPKADLLQGRAHRTRLVEMEPVRLMLAALLQPPCDRRRYPSPP